METLCFYLHFTCCNLILQMQPTCGHHSQPACTTLFPNHPTTPHTRLCVTNLGGISRVSFGTFQADKRAIFPILPSIAIASTADTVSFFFFFALSLISPLLLLPPFASATCCAFPEKKSFTVHSYFGPLLHLFYYFAFRLRHFPSAPTDGNENAAII